MVLAQTALLELAPRPAWARSVSAWLRNGARWFGDRAPESLTNRLKLGFTPPKKARNVVTSLEERPQVLEHVLWFAFSGHLLNLEVSGAADVEKNGADRIARFRFFVKEDNPRLVAVTSGSWAKVGACPVPTVAEDVLVRSCPLQQIVYGSEVVLLQLIDVDIRSWPRGPVSFRVCPEAMQHLEQLAVHLGREPLNQHWIGDVRHVGVGLGLAGIRIHDGYHLLIQRGLPWGRPFGLFQVNTFMVPGDPGCIPVDDEAVSVDELTRAFRMRAHGQDAGEPLALAWLAFVVSEDKQPFFAELPS